MFFRRECQSEENNQSKHQDRKKKKIKLYESQLGRKLDDRELDAIRYNLDSISVRDTVDHKINVKVIRMCTLPFIENGVLVGPKRYEHTVFQHLELEASLKSVPIDWKPGDVGVVIGRQWHLSEREMLVNEITNNVLNRGTLELWYQVMISDTTIPGKYWVRYDWIERISGTET